MVCECECEYEIFLFFFLFSFFVISRFVRDGEQGNFLTDDEVCTLRSLQL